jgi:hypothetical protein
MPSRLVGSESRTLTPSVVLYSHQMGAYFSVVDGTMNDAQDESTASSLAPVLLRVVFDFILASLGMNTLFL